MMVENERPFRLLLVDDEQGILDTYADFFHKRGFEVETANNGEAGWQKLQTETFDIALLDLQMPGLTGLQVAERVQQNGIDTSLVMLTGHGERQDIMQALNLGVSGWFEKSNIKMEDLYAKVQSAAQVIPLDDVRRLLSALPPLEK